MQRTLLLLSIVCGTAFAQHDHDAGLNQRGDHAMGFSHQKTTHHFELNRDGGLIEVRTNDPADTQSRDQIRDHFRHIVGMFAAGDFNVPMLVHGTKDIPGTAVMTQQKDRLHWQLEETPRGARILITADNQTAGDAVHEFLRYQIADHKTGDSTAIR